MENIKNIANRGGIGFSLIEVIIVVAILGVLLSLGNIQVQNIREGAKNSRNKANASKIYTIVKASKLAGGTDYVDKHWKNQADSDKQIINEIIFDLLTDNTSESILGITGIDKININSSSGTPPLSNKNGPIMNLIMPGLSFSPGVSLKPDQKKKAEIYFEKVHDYLHIRRPNSSYSWDPSKSPNPHKKGAVLVFSKK